MWIRVDALNGHGSIDEGWGGSYNFGASDRVRPRWDAAIDAGVDFIATDRYEQLAAVLRTTGKVPR